MSITGVARPACTAMSPKSCISMKSSRCACSSTSAKLVAIPEGVRTSTRTCTSRQPQTSTPFFQDEIRLRMPMQSKIRPNNIEGCYQRKVILQNSRIVSISLEACQDDGKNFSTPVLAALALCFAERNNVSEAYARLRERRHSAAPHPASTTRLTSKLNQSKFLTHTNFPAQECTTVQTMRV